MSPEMLSAVAALLSFLAACGAVVATWCGPLEAARLAERMRRDAQDREETRRLRLWVFKTLLQERGCYQSSEAVKALNMIDFAFADQFEVRQAWAKLLESLDLSIHATELEKKDRFRELLQRMSASLGLREMLGIADLDRIYLPSNKASP